jgi:hypothetical protein
LRLGKIIVADKPGPIVLISRALDTLGGGTLYPTLRARYSIRWGL